MVGLCMHAFMKCVRKNSFFVIYFFTANAERLRQPSSSYSYNDGIVFDLLLANVEKEETHLRNI